MVDFAVVLQSFGVCTSYLIVISDLMPDVMDNFGVTEGFWQDRPVWVLLGFAMCAPLSCFRKLDALRYTSGLSVLFVLFLMLMVFIFAIPGDGLHPCEGVPSDETCVGDKPMISVTTKTFQVFGIITNAYSCQSVSYCLRLMLGFTPHLVFVCVFPSECVLGGTRITQSYTRTSRFYHQVFYFYCTCGVRSHCNRRVLHLRFRSRVEYSRELSK